MHARAQSKREDGQAKPVKDERLTGGMRRGVLARMRIRKKMIFLHTLFSLLMTGILLITLRPALLRVVARGEQQEARNVLDLVLSLSPESIGHEQELRLGDAEVTIRRGVDPRSVPDAWVAQARAGQGRASAIQDRELPGVAVAWRPTAIGGEFWIAETSLLGARRAVLWVYGFTIAALLLVYAIVAAALEVFVLPRHVYGPISQILLADRALREGHKHDELVPESVIPADEIGEIMKSRNETIRTIRRHEAALARALDQIEIVASDLKRKNHMLETARRNLADADRLMSLGMMAAGVAHELNTPLAVAKGLAEKLDAGEGGSLSPTEAALLRRVIGRLERLSESLLDFARVRRPQYESITLHDVVDEALTLIRLERGAPGVEVVNTVPSGLIVEGDADRLVQVFVNLVRNATDAMGSAGLSGQIAVSAESIERDGDEWISVRVVDEGPGIDPAMLPSLFDPFVSSRLDDRGTGLGLAVSEGIVREHGGTIIASNRSGRNGAVFEVMLPKKAAATPSCPSETESQEDVSDVRV
ncbi:MAG: hypothetical protein Kow0022_10860 [Phycisphaerales bacterium]